MTAPAEVLEAAADLIEGGGWWHRDADGSVVTVNQRAGCPTNCALTAISRVTNFDTRASVAALSVLARHVRPTTRRHKVNEVSYGVQCWNDAPGRTQAEVVETMRAVAASTR